MTVCDLLFIVAFLISLVTIVVAAVLAVRGRRSSALKVLRFYCICAAGLCRHCSGARILETPTGDEHWRSLVL